MAECWECGKPATKQINGADVCNDCFPYPRPLPLHRTEAGYPNCSTCDGGGCLDCTDPA